jgi:hypothetical protein
MSNDPSTVVADSGAGLPLDASERDAQPMRDDSGSDTDAGPEPADGVAVPPANTLTVLHANGCTLWDAFPPHTSFLAPVAIAGGLALADGYQVYAYQAGQWSLALSADAQANAPKQLALVSGTGWLGVVRSDGSVSRGWPGPWTDLGSFANITASAAHDEMLWIATDDGKIHQHDGASWSELPATGTIAIALAGSTQGLLALGDASVNLYVGGVWQSIASPINSGWKQALATVDGTLYAYAPLMDALYKLATDTLSAVTLDPNCSAARIYAGSGLVADCLGHFAQLSDTGRWIDLGVPLGRAGVSRVKTGRAFVEASGRVLVAADLGVLTETVNGRWQEFPRIPSEIPFDIEALGGNAGVTEWVGGSGGMAQLTSTGPVLLAGTSHLDVHALHTMADGTVRATTLARLAPCAVDADCGGGQNFCDIDKTCGSRWTCDYVRTAPEGCCAGVTCPEGMICERYPSRNLTTCIRSERIVAYDPSTHATNQLYQTVMPIGPILGLFGNAQNQLFALSGDAAPTIFLLSYDGTTWHSSNGLCASNATRPAAYVAPNRLLLPCPDQLQDVALADTGVPSITTPIMGQGPLVQLWPADHALFLGGTNAQVRSSAGWITQSLPGPIPGSVIGGSWPRLLSYASNGSTASISWLDGGSWNTIEVPFHELNVTTVHSTDGWDTAYAIVRGGSLLKCAAP